ncbi:uncharacterized protein LOC121408819 [Lytechinus variegatus]|uniref:uncharacterized protein LOC121408819 n=1 Tax=Lytechinus variegatus TaxID=7654 RepID=UPI001BB25986|nr:uncharacterized protein LOC121408819 [Lytechinus variegatus]
MSTISCFTCGFVPDKTNPNPKERVQARWKNLNSNFEDSNIRLGDVLARSGTETGGEWTWHTKRCCRTCWRIQFQWDRARQTLERMSVEWSERSVTSQRLPTLGHHKTSSRKNFKNSLIKHIQQSKFQYVFRKLISKKSVKEVWVKEIKKAIRQEMKMLRKENICPSFNRKQNGKVKWKSVLKRVKKVAPLFYEVILASMTKSDFQQDSMTREDFKLLSPRVGMMINLPFFNLHGECRRYQRELTLNLFRLGANKAVIDFLYHLGITRGYVYASRYIRRKKNSVYKWCRTIEAEQNSPGAHVRDDMHPGFALMIRKPYEKSKRSSKPKPGRHSRQDCYGMAAKNRVPFRHLPEETPKKACELSVSVYLPNQLDYFELRMRMQVIIERILQANLALFADYLVTEHIPHEYSSLCAEKSDFVDLGMLEGNYSTPDQASDLLQKLEENTPKGYSLPLYGHEEMIKNVSKAQGSVEGGGRRALMPVPQDGHLRCIMMRDIMTDLYEPTSPNERATLRNLIHMFGHDGIKDKNPPSHHLDDFLLFVCCAMVVGFALEVLISNEDEMDDVKPEALLTKVSAEVVRRVWHQIPMDQITDIISAKIKYDKDSAERFCFCKENHEGERMLACSNINCKNGKWFHELCISNPQVGDEWYCSPTCQSSCGGEYCVCRTKTDEQLVWTCANKKCKRGRKFHHSCVRSTVPVAQGQQWYCSSQCRKGRNDVEEDQELRYLEAVTWRCLFNECMRDAEREGDGEALMGYWRIYMPELYKKGHDGFFLAAHRLLAGISGCMEPRVRQEVIHNRTMNFEGGAGKNVSLDIKDIGFIHQSKEIKLLFKKNNRVEEEDDDDAGQGEEDSRSKKQKMERPGGDENNTRHPVTNRYAIFKSDVAEFQKKFSDDELFKETRGRCIPSLVGKSFDQDYTRIEMMGMKKRLMALSKEYDEGLTGVKQSKKIDKPRSSSSGKKKHQREGAKKRKLIIVEKSDEDSSDEEDVSSNEEGEEDDDDDDDMDDDDGEGDSDDDDDDDDDASDDDGDDDSDDVSDDVSDDGSNDGSDDDVDDDEGGGDEEMSSED